MKVYAFDFDGTLTRRDTLIEFIRYACGSRRLFMGLLRFLPVLVLMKMKLYPNWKAKQRVFAWFFKGMSIADFNAHCQAFARDGKHLRRDDGFAIIRRAISEGHRVIIISASIDNWVRPFFDEFGEKVVVSCTKIDVRDEVVTGAFLTMNCYGAEKPKRLMGAFPLRETYRTVAFGDSRGDKELLDAADTGYFRTSGGHLRCVKGEKDALVEEVMGNMAGKESTQSGLPGGKTLGEVIRFGIVGAAATLLQYGLYVLLLLWLHPAVANTLAYLLSFAFNYVASTHFTFRVKSTAKRGAGFAFSHLINYTMQTVLLMLLLHVGIPKQWALIPVFAICVPVNFLLVRHFLHK